MDLRKIKKLIELLEDSALTELEIQEGEESIRLSRAQPLPTVSSLTPVDTTVTPATAIGVTTPTMAIASTESHAGITVTSPMVGTFYSRPNPNSDAYVKVGDHVSNDTTVCIIEAMKVFNEIPAEVSGRVVAILVDDDEPLEFGKPLFKIDTSN